MPAQPYWYGSGSQNIWMSSATSYPVYQSGTTVIKEISSVTDWDLAAVKAEPDDEFSWLRKRVREIEEMAFA